MGRCSLLTKVDRGGKQFKATIIGMTIALVAICFVGILVAALATPQYLTICQQITKAEDAGESSIDGQHTWTEVNMCRESSCEFDADSCVIDCPFGFEVDAKGCFASCQCASEARGTFQGDILIEREEIEPYLLRFGYMDEDTEFRQFSFDESNTKLWDRTIDYRIEEDIGDSIRDAIVRAITKFQKLIQPCIIFQHVMNPSGATHIHFFRGDGCWSGVGRLASRTSNKISLGIGCDDESTILHMLFHRLGFHHEHSRPDRDEHVAINYSNMKRSSRFNFKKLKSGKIREYNISYDLTSIVHLDGMWMSSNGQPTILVRKTGEAVVNNPVTLSQEDIKKVSSLYCSGDGMPTHPLVMSSPASQLNPNYQWSAWSAFEKCDVTCGKGKKRAARRCDGGYGNCVGSSIKFVVCHKPLCSGTSRLLPSSMVSKNTASSTIRGSSPAFEDSPSIDRSGEVEASIDPASYGVYSNYNPWRTADSSSFSLLTPFESQVIGRGRAMQSGNLQDSKNAANGLSPKSDHSETWSPWTSYGVCSKTCGIGRKSRFRKRKCFSTECRGRENQYLPCLKTICRN